MNKIIQSLLLILIPFYPFWAWLSISLTNRHISLFVIFIFIALAFYLIITQKVRVPKYLIFLILFTIYHLGSVFINNLIPPETNLIYFIFSDVNLFACIIFFVIENTHFEEDFLPKMNKCIFLIVLLSLIVSVIQIKYPTFFLSREVTGNVSNLVYLEQKRIFSIFSWINLNSVGITLPILVSILLSFYDTRTKAYPIIIMSGIVVPFLTKARYVMMSAIIVFSQLFFISKISIRKKIYFILIVISGVIVSINVAKIYNYNIQQVINDRIFEKGTSMASARTRITSFNVFILKFPEHPWFGVGPKTRLDVVQLLRGEAPLIHVGYLSYLYFYGIFGSLFLFLSIFYLLRNAWQIGKKYVFWGCFYGLLSFCFANTTMVYFNFSEIGIILLVIYLRIFNEKLLLESSAV